MSRKTRETTTRVEINLDGSGLSSCTTGLGFLDHMLGALAMHSGVDMNLTCNGDLDVDDHHTVEDCALVIGSAIDRALSERAGIARFGTGFAPLDESLARCVIDLSGRPGAFINLGLTREMLGNVACENIVHFFQSLAVSGRMTLHLDVLRGENDHHKAEAAFKACALAFREAVARRGQVDVVPSTKGDLRACAD